MKHTRSLSRILKTTLVILSTCLIIILPYDKLKVNALTAVEVNKGNPLRTWTFYDNSVVRSHNEEYFKNLTEDECI